GGRGPRDADEGDILGGGAGGTATPLETMRARDYPTIPQFTVFLENRVGELNMLLRRFESSEVAIVALAITEATECAFVRLIVSDPDEGREILSRAGLALVETELLGVVLPDTSRPLVDVC